MIPFQTFALEHEVCYDGKYYQTDALLNDFELHEAVWTTVAIEAYTVGWHLATVFKEGYCPYHAKVMKMLLKIKSKIV